MIDADGALDRDRMRERCSPTRGQGQARSILHPMIGAEASARPRRPATAWWCSTCRCWPSPAAGGASSTASSWSTASEDTQCSRVMAALGLDRPRCVRVIAQQATREQRRAMADAVIYNDGISRRRSWRRGAQLWATGVRPPDGGRVAVEQSPPWNNSAAGR
jgi:dephospho-CoA kinase